MTWETDLSASAKAFKEIVWPKIIGMCGGGELIPVEGSTDTELAKKLDQMAGIDAWQVQAAKGIRGIASRVQFGAAYGSFTIRAARASGASTELEKRRYALNNPDVGYIFPALTIQAYVENDQLIYACIIKTADLIRSADDRYEWVRFEREKNNDDGNVFLKVWVEWLKAEGIEVKEYLTQSKPYSARREKYPF
jgi:hypothetical protein